MLGNFAFQQCAALKDVTVAWETPLTIPSGVFAGITPPTGVTLHVPAGTGEAYQGKDVWKEFQIVELPLIPALSVTPKTLSFIDAGETKTITVNASAAWTAQCDASWLTLSATSGTGNGTITVTAPAYADEQPRTANIFFASGTLKKTITVTQNPKPGPAFVALDYTELTLPAGASQRLIVTAYPKDADINRDVKWYSSNNDIATVSANGTVTALAPGRADITVVANVGGQQTACRVRVVPVEQMVSVTPGSDNTLRLALVAPSDADFTLSFDVDLPEGFALDAKKTAPDASLAASYTLTVTGKRVEMKPNGLRSGGTMEKRNLLTFACTAAPGTSKGSYKAALRNLTFTPTAGYALQNITVPFTFTYTVANETIDGLRVYAAGGALRLTLPKAETVHIYNVGDRSKKQLDFGDSKPYYIPRIEFVGRDGNLAVFSLNRQQNHFRLYYVNDKTLLPKLILEERNKAYVDSRFLQHCHFVPGGFVYISERDGYRHLYSYSDKGVLQRQITSGKYDVMDFYGADAAGNMYYQAADASPMRRSVYRIDPKGVKTRLDGGEGTNNAIFSQNFAYYINTFHNAHTPTVTAVYATGKPKPLRTLEDNAALRSKLAGYRISPKEFITVRNAEGQSLNAWIVKPLGFDASKKYPVLMVQYSGPDSQQVLDSYGYGWEQVLAAEGFIVACVDGRGTGARGEEWRKCTYLRLGVKESADQIAAAKSLSQLPYVDGSRIALWGWSFGGYNTLMSLCHGGTTFKLGIAVAPVTDWSYYDTIYTERYMRTPRENPEGYKASSVLEVAANLRSRLLLIHGSADDNVHVQNAMDIAERFVQADLPFDMAIYTDKNHSIYGGKTRDHLYKKMIAYLKAHL